ncbi:MAG: anion permease [Bacteroidales bacterium]|nr:anion permease [Bacteroidales bacterium]
MSPAIISSIILVFLVVLFITELIPFTATAILGCVLFAVTGVAEYNDVFSGFAHNNVIMLIGILIVADAMINSGLATLIGDYCIKLSRNNEKRFIFFTCIAIYLMSMWLDNTSIFAIFLSIMVSVSSVNKNFRLINMAMPVVICAMVGGASTLIGCVVNIAGQSVITNMTEYEFGIFDFTKAGIPFFLITLVYVMTIGMNFSKRTWNDRKNEEIDTSQITKLFEADARRIVLILFVLLVMIAGFVTAVFPTGLIAMIAALLCQIFRLVDIKKTLRVINWDVIVRLAAMMGIVKALEVSGFNKMLSDLFITHFGNNTSPYVILIISTVISMAISQVMSNTATVLILLPPILAVTNGLGYNPLPFALAVIYGASLAFMMPTAGVCIGLSMIAGYKFKDYFRYSWLLSVLLAIGIIVLVPIFFPFRI